MDGLRQLLPARELTLVVNTGDDLEWWGLHVSPDLDSIVYVLGGVLSKDRGWGVDGDTSPQKLAAPLTFVAAFQLRVMLPAGTELPSAGN